MALEILAYKRYAAVAKYSGREKIVEIPRKYKGLPVTEILEGAFAGTEVEGVLVPDTLWRMGDNAFANCTRLRHIGYGQQNEDTSRIDAPKTAFENPELIFSTGNKLPPSLQMVGDGVFRNTALKTVEFEAEELELGESVFEDCSSLEMVDCFLCERLTLGRRIFMNSSLERFYAPRVRLPSVPDYAFANCSRLKTVLTNIINVGNRSFYQCTKLKRLYTPKNLREIGAEAFSGCEKLQVVNKDSEVVLIPAKHKDRLREMVRQKESPELLQNRQALVDALQQIADKKKENETMEHMERHRRNLFGDMDTGKGPLFELALCRKEELAAQFPTTMKGAFVQENQTLYFQIHIPAALSRIRLEVVDGECLNNVRSLLTYVAKNELEVILYGIRSGSQYAVQDILLAQQMDGNNKVLAMVFREAKERLARPAPKVRKAAPVWSSATMTTETEFDAFIEMCGSRIPGWVLDAYEKNKRIVKSTSAGTEARRHAKTAMEILLNTDWNRQLIQVPAVEETRKLLDGSFYGMESVKNRVMEVVAQIRMTGELPKWGILLAGPAGTGKTSVAKAIARILSLELIQMDMSTLGEDPDEISGSSRVYGNASAGMLLRKMQHIRSSTAVLLVNELDKAGGGKSSRSAADVLLTVLDKTGFYENFLEEIIPTDNLFCVATCNALDKISKPMRDRFMIIEIPAYTPDEKKVIFRDYVLPEMMKRNDIASDSVSVAEEAMDCLVSEYAREPGARDLEQYAERFIGDFCKEAAQDSLHKKCYSVEDIRRLLGPSKTVVRQFAIHPGEVNAAFYHDGKAHFFLLEACVLPGTGQFRVLGPVAKIQEEYCKVAYLCVRNTINASVCDLSKCDVTIFIPHTIPDGPDNHVGFAAYVAICSRILNRSIALKQTCVVGGCDLNGSLYFDECTLTPLLQAMKAAGITTLYAPMSTNQLIDPVADGNSGVAVVEAPDAETLFRLSVGCN